MTRQSTSKTRPPLPRSTDGVWVTHDGSFHGRQAIEKGYVQLDVKSWQIGSYITTVDRVIAVGNEVRSTGRWSCVHKNRSGAPGNADGHYSWVIVREGDTWKIRKNTASGSWGYCSERQNHQGKRMTNRNPAAGR
jgi:ketosteroid isomerase-like protein